mgnify:CR=1 FL=1
MFTITCSKVPSRVPVFETPTEQAKARIAKAANNDKKRGRHWRQHVYSHPSQEEVANRALSKGSERIREMEIEIEERANALAEDLAAERQAAAEREARARWQQVSPWSSLPPGAECSRALV